MTITQFHMMAKPTSYRCNLKCEYCFYLEKENSLVDNIKTEKQAQQKQPDIMSDNMLKQYIRDYIHSQPGEQIDFSWQGGEPTLAGIEFYKKAVQYQKQYGQGKTITNSFQTNAVAINKQWAEFFAEHNFLIGISIDGLPEVHDQYRISVNGKPTFARVKRAIELLIEHSVEFNTLTVINDKNWDKGAETYHYLKSLGAKYLQFIPIIEVAESAQNSSHHYAPGPNPTLCAFSVPAHGYGIFMTAVFDEWLKEDVGTIFVRMFDSILATWLGHPASVCVQSKECGQAVVIEANGDVYSCDHYVYPANNLGNIKQTELIKIVNNKKQLQFAKAKSSKLTEQCQQCDVHKLCYGGCPKHRIVTINGEKHKQNYLCPSYQQIFKHTAPAMHMMRQSILQGGTAQDAVATLLRMKRQ
ncbi:anaerobic sulfatase maturase [Plesiomonas shigelloides]|uniref:anaerobic sulfatase maturase n=1 Tax=Plesiomonas shigelloides TaxID=703 RepID=UPI001261936E|nr:anaerobic sulfatase maturase [Plesiomonas shigelloides]KAB7668320.1 anaerobic sulfatase maturase [Plesiomonas shigelloides]